MENSDSPTASLEAFLSRLLADDEQVGRLAGMTQAPQFEAACLALAQAWDLPIEREELRAVMRARRQAWARANAA